MSFVSWLKRVFGSEVRLGLALGSGGARGLAHIGVLKVLHREGVPLHCIVGTSAGALIGGLYSAGTTPEKLEELTSRLSLRETAKLFLPSLRRGGLIDGRRVKRFIEPYTAGKSIEDLSPRFACVATDLFSGRRIVLKRGDLLESIRASISIPVVFTPVLCEGRVLVDGGVVDPLPINLAFEMGATFVIAVRVNREYNQEKSLSSGGECVFRREDIADKGGPVPPILETILSTVSIYERELSEFNARSTGDHMLVEPELQGIEILDFHKGQQAIAAGALAMRDRLHEVRRRIQ